jgi:MoxR-like ATPase
MYDQGKGRYRRHRGPVFTNLLLADEINRASPRVQSALLEAMQERRVTLWRKSIPLERPFLVVATQNPIEQAGTFELPEAQLDRFMLLHKITYPTAAEEKEIVDRTLGLETPEERDQPFPRELPDTIRVRAAKDPILMDELLKAMREVRRVRVDPALVEHAVRVVGITRHGGEDGLGFVQGASPRATLSWLVAARARAFLHNRDYVTMRDLEDLRDDILLHRIRRSDRAIAQGVSASRLLDDLIQASALRSGDESGGGPR